MPPFDPVTGGISKRADYKHTPSSSSYEPKSTKSTKNSSGSLLRLLSPLRAGSSSRSETPSLTLHVPDYGSLLIQTSDRSYEDPSTSRPSISSRQHSSSRSTPRSSTPVSPADTPGAGDDYLPPPSQNHEYELCGTLEVGMPPHLGKRRVKAIRIGMSGKTRLDMGKGRGWEEDEIFKRKIEIRGADDAGIVLEPGTQLFAFSLFVPDTMPVHDWHPNAYCGMTLFGEIEGLTDKEKHKSSSTSRSRSRTPFVGTPTSIPGTPKAGSRSSSPNRASNSTRRGQSTSSVYSGPSGNARARQASMDTLAENGRLQGLDSVMNQLEELSVTRQVLPQAPSYSTPEGTKDPAVEDIPWLKGVHTTNKPFEVLYNPNPTGGLTELAMRILGEQEGLGGYRLELLSEIFTVCAPVQIRLTLPTPPLTTTIYCFRLLLAQTVSLYSPRDPPDTEPVNTTRNFVIAEQGQIPPRGALGGGIPALWRGIEAGGNDMDELALTVHGMLPDDEKCRPTSLPQMKSPLRLTHHFIAEIFFSVHGEDDRGRKLEKPGPAGLRFFRLSKPVVVPSCAMIPMWLLPPTYEEKPTVHPLGPCPHRPLQNDWAKDAAEYKPDLECVLCRAGVPPSTRPGWRDCACGNRGQDLEERGRRLNEAPMLPSKWTVEGESLAEREEGGNVEEERRGRRGGRD